MDEVTVVTDREQFRSVAGNAPTDARVPLEVRVDVEDPFDAYRRARDGPGGVFLETTGGQSGWGYFGVDPIDRLTVSAEALLADRDAAEAVEGRGDYRSASPTLAALEGFLEPETLHRGDCSVPYPCGAIGWLSYDVARELEDLPETTVDDRSLPRLQLAKFDRLAAWEEPHEGALELRVTACPRLSGFGRTNDPVDGSEIDAAYDRGLDRAIELAEAAIEGDPSVGPAPVDSSVASFESDCGKEVFADRVRRVKAYVRDGDTFQANISQRLVADAAVHPVEAYDALRRVNPAPYSGLIEFSGRAAAAGGDRWNGVDLVSASPELLVHRDETLIETEPIAGTRPRGETESEDEALARELRTDEKERAEHAMLVDLERNDLGKVSEYGTVEVSEYRRVDRYSEVMHLVSLVTGRLRDDVTLGDAIGATFPGGTITGAPKPRTMEIIDELESTRRGPYTGSMAIFGFDGRATLNIVIRTLTRYEKEYHLRVGAGIVHDSVPELEYEETLAKGRALVNAIDEALARGRMTVGRIADD